MNLRALRLLLLCCIAWLAAACSSAPPPRQPPSGVQRLYVLYCGELHIPDVSPWTPEAHAGEPAVFSDNCYLIRHAKGWMLWDSGLTDALIDKPEGVQGARGMRMMRSQTLLAQLEQIGVTPAQIGTVAFSHTHPDHVGNANLFAGATLYIQKAEYAAAFGSEPAKYGFVPATYDRLRSSRVVQLDGDFDVFGDGSVRILSTPGHTPGHQSLLVRLPQTGAVVLSGDAAHFEENFTKRRVPGFNFDKDQSLQSMDKLDRIVKAERAQLWINHDAAQNATLLHAPKFYQ